MTSESTTDVATDSPSALAVTASSVSRIGLSCLSLVLQCLNPRGELPRAARISRDWYAAASHPATWRCTIHFDPLTERLTICGLQMSLEGSEVRAAVASSIYWNLSVVSCFHQLYVSEIAALRRFRRIMALRILPAMKRAAYQPNVRQLESLLGTADSMQHLQYLTLMPPCSDDLTLPTSLQHLHLSGPLTAAGEASKEVLPLLHKLIGLPRLRTIHVGASQTAIDLSREMKKAGLPLDHPLTIVHSQLCSAAQHGGFRYNFSSVIAHIAGSRAEQQGLKGKPAAIVFEHGAQCTWAALTSSSTTTTETDARASAAQVRLSDTSHPWIRTVRVSGWTEELEIWQRVLERFPDVDQLVIDAHCGVQDGHVHTQCQPDREESKVWARPNDPPSRLHTLRITSSFQTFCITRMSCDLIRCSGATFRGVHTLELTALETVDQQRDSRRSGA
jgi:hypothetical protein